MCNVRRTCFWTILYVDFFLQTIFPDTQWNINRSRRYIFGASWRNFCFSQRDTTDTFAGSTDKRGSSRSKIRRKWPNSGAKEKIDRRWTMTNWAVQYDSITGKGSSRKLPIPNVSCTSSVPHTCDLKKTVSNREYNISVVIRFKDCDSNSVPAASFHNISETTRERGLESSIVFSRCELGRLCIMINFVYEETDLFIYIRSAWNWHSNMLAMSV